jgi:hypothetical protein
MTGMQHTAPVNQIRVANLMAVKITPCSLFIKAHLRQMEKPLSPPASCLKKQGRSHLLIHRRLAFVSRPGVLPHVF